MLSRIKLHTVDLLFLHTSAADDMELTSLGDADTSVSRVAVGTLAYVLSLGILMSLIMILFFKLYLLALFVNNYNSLNRWSSSQLFWYVISIVLIRASIFLFGSFNFDRKSSIFCPSHHRYHIMI